MRSKKNLSHQRRQNLFAARLRGSNMGLVPDQSLPSVVLVPPSKSIAQRAIMAASLTPGETSLLGISRERACEDVQAALEVSRNLGADLHWRDPEALTLVGQAPGQQPSVPLEVGESGTLARLVTAIASFTYGASVEVRPGASLSARTSPALFECLHAAGARFVRGSTSASGSWPVTIQGAQPPTELLLRLPRSSQEVTALLLVSAAFPGSYRIHVKGKIPSRAYIDLTIDVLRTFGVDVELSEPRFPGGESFLVRGTLVAPSKPIALEPDASAAAVALAAAAIRGIPIRIPGDFQGSKQGDLEVVRHLQAFGVAAGLDQSGLFAKGPVCRGAEINLEAAPDLAPPLVAVAAAAALRLGATSRFLGLGTLPYKECDRLSVLVGGLRQLGLKVAVDPACGSLQIEALGKKSQSELLLDPTGDHRMAFAFALFGLVQSGVLVKTPEVVAKSWPSFWNDLAAPEAIL